MLMTAIPRRTAKAPAWVKGMRQSLAGQNGEGWMVRDIRGRIQLTCRFVDGQRSSVVLELPWAGTSQAQLLTTAEKLKALMIQGRGLKEAHNLLTRSSGASTAAGEMDWTAMVEDFRNSKVETGAIKATTWKKMYAPEMRHLLLSMEARPRPVNSKTLLQRLVGVGGAPGSDGRKHRIQYASQLLKHAVNECAADPRWMPPADLKPFVGSKPKGTTLTTFAKDDQIVRLLAGIDNPQWRNAVGFVACFGLRGVELTYLTPKGGFLHCSYRKRTARKEEGTDTRDIVGLDPIGLEGLSANLLALLEEQGNACFPPTCFRTNEEGELLAAGHALSQYLGRNKVWQELVAETAALPLTGNTGNELVPYSLRHGYAARAHEDYGFSPRKTAGLMGHSLLTHSRHYGSQVDQEILDTALQQAQAVVTRRKLESQV